MRPIKSKKIPKSLIGIRLNIEMKTAARIAATREHRSLSNYLENVLRKDLEIQGLYPLKK